MTNDTETLRRIRARHAAIAPGQWSLVADGERSFVEAAGRNGELFPIFEFHRGASPDEVDFALAAPETVGFLLGLLDRSFAEIRKLKGGVQPKQPNGPAKDFAAECAMKCGEPAFKVFLEQQHGLERPLTKERVEQKVRTLLRVTSRKDINDNDDAARRWRELRAAYDAWRKAGQS